MKTFTGNPIPEDTLGILYLCEYDRGNQTIKVRGEVTFPSAFDALQAYCNIPNPESQMASGGTKEEFEKDLIILHGKLNDPEWVRELSDCI